jgi:hypothetical protein
VGGLDKTDAASRVRLPFGVRRDSLLALFEQLKGLCMRGERCILTGGERALEDVSAKKNKKTKKKRTALVICRDRKQFWTTQTQFWQWVRDGVVVKIQDQPLTGAFQREHEELMVMLSNTVLNLAHPNHMREALASRRVGLSGK